jgi:hypothetical protein
MEGSMCYKKILRALPYGYSLQIQVLKLPSVTLGIFLSLSEP